MSARGGGGLRQALSAAWARGLFTLLAQLYQELPPTTCGRQGACCGLLPPMHAVEMAAWLHRFLSLPHRERSSQARKLIEHFLCNAAQRRPCPWARPGACAIYAHRFWGCRAYGLWSPRAHAARAAQAREGQEAVARTWAGLGVGLPEEVLAPPPPYCGQVKPLRGGAPDDAALEELERRVQALGQDMPGLERLHDFGGDLSYAVAALALGQPQALGLKVAMTKALLAGQEDEAAELLAQAGAAARRWSLGL